MRTEIVGWRKTGGQSERATERGTERMFTISDVKYDSNVNYTYTIRQTRRRSHTILHKARKRP